ncbi:hypothetical protein D3C71_1687590 [compost metagenome]
MATDGAGAEPQPGRHFAYRHGAAQHAQPFGADLEHLVRVNRQQRDHAAQQHREQIQRNRAQDDGPAADELDTIAKALPHAADQRRARRGIQHRHAQQHQHGQHQRHHRAAIGEFAATHRIEHAA